VLFAGGALVIGDNLVFLLGCLLLGSASAAWLLARWNLAGLELSRRLPARAQAGSPTPIEYLLRVPRRRPALGIEVEDRPSPASRPTRLRASFEAVPRRGAVRIRTTITFVHRGWTTLAPALMWSRYPLGLYRAAREVAAPASVLVRPREGRPTTALRSRLLGRTRETVRRPLLLRGEETLYGLREFRDGDDPRRIHWRTTARRGVATVSEWRAESGRRVVVVLGRGGGAGGRAARSFERAVSCAATVWRAVHRLRIPASLHLGQPGGPHRGGRRGLESGLDALARVRGQGSRRPLRDLESLARQEGSRSVVYVCAGPEPDLQRRLAAAAGPGGDAWVLRCDDGSFARYVRGIP
jgi:uncharacterized protein (DUF58 family)